MDQSPVFDQRPGHQQTIKADYGTVHVALVKFLSPQIRDANTISSIGQILAQLSQLGMVPCLVVDVNFKAGENPAVWRRLLDEQIERITIALEQAGAGTRRIDNLFARSVDSCDLRILSRETLVRPLRQGRISIIPPVAFNEQSTKMELVLADTVVMALSRELAGQNYVSSPTDNPETITANVKSLQKQISLDRLILLDPWGGIPKLDRSGNAHVFVNLDQELEDITNDLMNSFDDEAVRQALKLPPRVLKPDLPGTLPYREALHHINNITLLRDTLALLPSSSSALVTTATEAAMSSKEPEQSMPVSGVGTRRQKNPLIHNLLTDRPAHSSSLPLGRLSASGMSDNPPVVATSTFVKRGMPLTILPDPRKSPWVADNHGQPRMSLNDPSIDLPRLVHLIEDSFNRKIDVDHYLKRVNDRIAGLIIAGEYEGGALLTWETPPGIPDDGSPASISRLVPYLDKFAVLKRSQGAGGVADIVFNAMVRGCFPDGVCWRSRKNNPVNKWYFERARGTWKLPGTEWTMFWTTDEVEGSVFQDYEGVCRNVVPSWADQKHLGD